MCSHVAALHFKIETACRLGYTNPSKTSLPCQWNHNFKTEVWLQCILSIIHVLNYDFNIILRYDFTKPKHKKSKCTEHSDEEDSSASVLPAKRTKLATGPQHLPKISAEALYHSIYNSAPQACLFTIVPGFERQQDQGSPGNTQQIVLSEQIVEPVMIISSN